MKCKLCNGCLKVSRIDREDVSYIFWYCAFCQKIFDFHGKRNLVENEELLKEIKDNYLKEFGSKL